LDKKKNSSVSASSYGSKSKDDRKKVTTDPHSFLNGPAPYFGVPLKQIVEREGRLIPILVSFCTEYLIEHSLDEEGILRLSGSLTEMNEIRQQIEHEGKLELNGKDPHAVAGILKSFFRELPEPLINQQLNEGIAAVLTYGNGEELLIEIRNAINSLPLHSKALFKHLVYFFKPCFSSF